MKIKFIPPGLTLLLAVSLILSCNKDDNGNFLSDLNINLYSINKDIELGEYMDSLISADPVEFPVLDPVAYPEAYEYMEDMFMSIISSDELKHRDDFDWELTIIDKDVLNAFAVPGGKLYFYTGIMKYLDDAAGFAGVLAHEIAHSDRRHATQQMTQVTGLSLALAFLTGNDQSKLQEVAQQMVVGLASLQFSRTDEYEADEYSVKYLGDTKYHPKGIARFFEKLAAENQSAETAEFLSTHPADENRLENIEKIWKAEGSPVGGYFEEEWAMFKSNLPQ
jgi:predicted Zn-dependent protease